MIVSSGTSQDPSPKQTTSLSKSWSLYSSSYSVYRMASLVSSSVSSLVSSWYTSQANRACRKHLLVRWCGGMPKFIVAIYWHNSTENRKWIGNIIFVLFVVGYWLRMCVLTSAQDYVAPRPLPPPTVNVKIYLGFNIKGFYWYTLTKNNEEQDKNTRKHKSSSVIND